MEFYVPEYEKVEYVKDHGNSKSMTKWGKKDELKDKL